MSERINFKNEEAALEYIFSGDAGIYSFLIGCINSIEHNPKYQLAITNGWNLRTSKGSNAITSSCALFFTDLNEQIDSVKVELCVEVRLEGDNRGAFYFYNNPHELEELSILISDPLKSNKNYLDIIEKNRAILEKTQLYGYTNPQRAKSPGAFKL